MEALFLLIPISVVLVFAALWLYFAASDNGQFDDLVGPGLRLLQDDDRAHAQDDAGGAVATKNNDEK
jgi:cbb3-type cytochrome oxidase maturation protein